MAPIWTLSPSSTMLFSASIRPMSTISSGALSRMRSTGSSDWPPAITLASSTSGERPSASSTVVGAT